MTLKEMIEALVERGYSQYSIAAESKTTQTTVFRAAHGADIRYVSGRAIERFYDRVVNGVNDPAQKIPEVDRRSNVDRRQGDRREAERRQGDRRSA